MRRTARRILAPAGTPREIVTRVVQELAKAVTSPDLRGKLVQMGIDPVGGTPGALAQFMNDEIARWARVINIAGVRAER